MHLSEPGLSFDFTKCQEERILWNLSIYLSRGRKLRKESLKRPGHFLLKSEGLVGLISFMWKDPFLNSSSPPASCRPIPGNSGS